MSKNDLIAHIISKVTFTFGRIESFSQAGNFVTVSTDPYYSTVTVDNLVGSADLGIGDSFNFTPEGEQVSFEILVTGKHESDNNAVFRIKITPYENGNNIGHTTPFTPKLE